MCRSKKIDTQVAMALLHEEDDHNHKDEKKEHGAENRYSLEPEKVHPTGEFIAS